MFSTSSTIMHGPDEPVSQPKEDLYGFNALADSLSLSILALDDQASVVIGIEGQWGAGKTSLLNLLLLKLKAISPPDTHVLQISPWLNPGGVSSVESLLLPVAAILDEEAAKKHGWIRRMGRKMKLSRASALATDVLSYAQKASGRIAPIAELAGDWMPGAGVAAKAMKNISAADLSARRQTTAALRANIEKRIAALNMRFIVVLDDLDRLEPTQAVEVLRMVRSVADFSRFRYIMCYDPDVLSHAVERGLGVTNGRLYLQKIIQFSYNLPRPEFSDMRREWVRGATELFVQVNGTAPGKAVISDLIKIGDSFGTSLRTPREVSQALSSLAFRYSSLKEFVWFPDLGLLQLLRVTEPGLYEWTEKYVTRYSSHASREGFVTTTEIDVMRERLEKLLSKVSSESALTNSDFSNWLPGIASDDNGRPSLFGDTPGRETYLNDDKRLCSSDYWRYYFAFSPSKNVLSPGTLGKIFDLAKEQKNRALLAEFLINQIADNGFTSVTWFEKILDRLTAGQISKLSNEQTSNLLWFLFNHGDEVLSHFYKRKKWYAEHEIDLSSLAIRLLKGLHAESHVYAVSNFRMLLDDGMAIYWIAVFLRAQLWDHGIKGNRAIPETQRVFTEEQLSGMCESFSRRMGTFEIQQILRGFDDLSGLLYAWQEMSSPDVVNTWIESVTQTDDDFLRILLKLRYRGESSAKGSYQGLDLNSVATFFGGSELILSRLERIEREGTYTDLQSSVKQSISYSRGYE